MSSLLFLLMSCGLTDGLGMRCHAQPEPFTVVYCGLRLLTVVSEEGDQVNQGGSRLDFLWEDGLRVGTLALREGGSWSIKADQGRLFLGRRPASGDTRAPRGGRG